MSDMRENRKNRLASKRLAIVLACLPCVLLATSCEDVFGSPKAGADDVLSLQEQIASAKADIERMQASSVQARAIEAWLSASVPIQPLIVTIIRSLSSQSTVKQLQLAREADSPGRVAISLQLSSDDPESQTESILKAIHNLGFREQSVTQTNSDGTIKFDAVVVWKDSVQASAAPPPPASADADEDETSLQATLRSLQDYAHALASQNANSLEFAAKWQPYFALTTEADAAEMGTLMKLRESELAVASSSFKAVDCDPFYPAWSKAIPQVLQGEVVIEDSYAKVLNWLGTMEKVRPTTRICKISISRSNGGDKCRFDLVLESPLLGESQN